jgi:integrase
MVSKISEDIVKSLASPATGNKVHYFAGAALQGFRTPRGFGVRVTAAGAKAFVLNYRLRGREHRFTIGVYPDWSVIRAIKTARDLRQRVDRGENPLDDRKPVPKEKTIGSVLDDYIKERANGKEKPLRGAGARKSAFERLVKPAIGNKGITEIIKDDIIAMRRRISKSAGPVMADRTFAYFRAAMNWFAESVPGGDAFDTRKLAIGDPLTDAKERRRTRTLSPDEIRLIWPELEKAGTFGALCKVLLLTGQRRNEAAGMCHAEVVEDGLWEIPAARYKGKRPHPVPISEPVAAIIKAQLEASGCEYVFPSRVKTPFTGFWRAKEALDEAVLEAMRQKAITRAHDPKKVAPIPPWTLHDLRRTARTMMSAIGIPSEISERVLGHAQDSLRETYDRHKFLKEKREALDRLAAHIIGIVTPAPPNVESLSERRRA